MMVVGGFLALYHPPSRNPPLSIAEGAPYPWDPQSICFGPVGSVCVSVCV